MERLTNRNAEIPLPDSVHATYWALVHEKLARYEDAEQEGRLVVLPCKVGDTIYVIKDGKIYDGRVYHISYSDYQEKIIATAWTENGIGAAFEHFGKTVFLTRAEAEAAMKGVTDDA